MLYQLSKPYLVRHGASEPADRLVRQRRSALTLYGLDFTSSTKTLCIVRLHPVARAQRLGRSHTYALSSNAICCSVSSSLVFQLDGLIGV